MYLCINAYTKIYLVARVTSPESFLAAACGHDPAAPFSGHPPVSTCRTPSKELKWVVCNQVV